MSGNGVDLGAIYQAAVIAVGTDLKAVKAEMAGHELRHIKSDGRHRQMDGAGIRQTLRDYHGSVLGHGIQITDLNDRVTRLEQPRAA